MVVAVLLKALKGMKHVLLSAASVLPAACIHSNSTLIFYHSLHLLQQSLNGEKPQTAENSNWEQVGIVFATAIHHLCAAANLSWRTWRSDITKPGWMLIADTHEQNIHTRYYYWCSHTPIIHPAAVPHYGTCACLLSLKKLSLSLPIFSSNYSRSIMKQLLSVCRRT